MKIIAMKKTRSGFSLEQKKTNANSSPSESNSEFSHFAELVIRESLQNFQRMILLQKIDLTLEERNKEEFLRLTEELKKIS